MTIYVLAYYCEEPHLIAIVPSYAQAVACAAKLAGPSEWMKATDGGLRFWCDLQHAVNCWYTINDNWAGLTIQEFSVPTFITETQYSLAMQGT